MTMMKRTTSWLSPDGVFAGTTASTTPWAQFPAGAATRPCSLARNEAANEVERPANLERSSRLKLFAFE